MKHEELKTEYTTPKLETGKLYETPLLIDVREVSGTNVCITSGGAADAAVVTPGV